MKKYTPSVLAATILLLAVLLWEPFLDILPIDQSRWLEKDGIYYHNGYLGDRDTGWYQEDDSRYYLDPARDGAMVTGWAQIGTAQYCFSPAGRMYTGWVEYEGNRRYLDVDGKMRVGWTTIDGDTYFMDENGFPLTLWQQIDENRYYFDSAGILHTGWLTENGRRYYFHPDGTQAFGWLRVDDGAYYLDPESGAAVSGWLKLQGKRYYLDDAGRMQTGWIRLGNVRYYLAEGGTAVQGWQELDGKQYYFLEDGSMATGAVEVEGETLYFTSTGATVLVVNRWNPVPENYEADLVYAYRSLVDRSCAEALNQMLTDCQAAGCAPIVMSSYRSYSVQTRLFRNQIYQQQRRGYSYDEAYALASQIVAIPGTSEHQLGLALDIVDKYYSELNEEQATTKTQKWLMEHCWEYGFILRYPKDSTEFTGIIYEPWHYRYVGVELAMELRDLDISLEEYLQRLTLDVPTA